ncbi:hypothetical protein DPEC_G00211280 [Dallia pectoralis]|uniref:Uncharacterized protein n=1 Tax=Dallia pectoralis TaxID=75939 RepID=A0ACC2G617_DALPE|nr:hypothetical protein DPEC_G00211280 [Dallia pectoralis]
MLHKMSMGRLICRYGRIEEKKSVQAITGVGRIWAVIVRFSHSNLATIERLQNELGLNEEEKKHHSHMTACFLSLFWKEEMELTLVGLQYSGKTTFVNVIASGQFNEDMIPTVGFNMRKVTKGNVTIKIWDIGGQPRFRSMWERYCRGVNAIVYMVDAADREKVEASRNELHNLLEKPQLQGIPVLVLGNKRDLQCALDEKQLIEKLNLSAIQDREICCYSVSCKDKDNIDITLQWLIEHRKSRRSARFDSTTISARELAAPQIPLKLLTSGRRGSDQMGKGVGQNRNVRSWTSQPEGFYRPCVGSDHYNVRDFFFVPREFLTERRAAVEIHHCPGVLPGWNVDCVPGGSSRLITFSLRRAVSPFVCCLRRRWSQSQETCCNSAIINPRPLP